uniref:lambda-crystallin homolog isoform X2 n=1 Tax=Myxine glutinosa TaxID=7769 RepID=UPI00358F6667
MEHTGCFNFNFQIPGVIGRNWSMLFTAAGFSVSLQDSNPEQLTHALSSIRLQMLKLEERGELLGKRPALEQLNLIKAEQDLSVAVNGAVYIQECIPEDLEMKRGLFSTLDHMLPPTSIIGSSSSCLLPSTLFADLKCCSRCLVCHPVNPPYLIRLVELVPHPKTEAWVTLQIEDLMRQLGRMPITLRVELPGFALNRLQYALLTEAWRLVESGALTPDEVDLVITEGLGPRYAFSGPLETMHLNGAGIRNYCQLYGESICSVSNTFGPTPKFSGVVMDSVHKAMCDTVGDSTRDLEKRQCWRDRCLAALSKLKRTINVQDKEGKTTEKEQTGKFT